jgi:hypothetical protein
VNTAKVFLISLLNRTCHVMSLPFARSHFGRGEPLAPAFLPGQLERDIVIFVAVRLTRLACRGHPHLTWPES